MNKFLKAFVVLLILAAIAAVIWIGYLFYTVNKGVSDSYEDIGNDRSKSELRSKEVSVEDSFTVLIMGIDENESRSKKENLSRDQFRTDSMILATFDKNSNSVKMLSIPRDSLTYMSNEQTFDKVNHAHALGGVPSAVDAVENLVNVPVDYYIRLNFDALVEMVDTLNGVEFDVPFDMVEPNPYDDGKTRVKKGKQTLDGEQALAVVRSRQYDSDFGRGERQMQMIKAIMQKAKSTGAISKYDDLVKVVARNVNHNFTMNELGNMATYFSKNEIDFESSMILGDDYWAHNGAYYYKPANEHLFVISKTLREILNLDPPVADDFENIRYEYWMNPGEIIPTDVTENYYLEEEPYYTEDSYDSPYGTGFDVTRETLQQHENEGDTNVDDVDGMNNEYYDDGTENNEQDSENNGW